LIISSTVLVTQNIVYAGEPLIVIPNPADGDTVTTDLVYLRVLVSSRREPVGDCLVKFYVDGEFIEEKTTNWEGLTLIDILPSRGNHTWYVIAEKSGYDRNTTKTFSFSFHPVRKLTIESIFGVTFGSGEYPIGNTVDFGVNPTTIHTGEDTRFVFKEWRSDDEGGYNGFRNEWFLTLDNDVRETAFWEKQHYVEFETEGLGSVSLESGWYPAGSVLDVQVNPGPDHFFTLWRGVGSGSYSGNLENMQIQVFGPIVQTAYFNTDDGTLVVISDYGETFGSGLYQEGDNVEFGVTPEVIYSGDETRFIFAKWISRYGSGYEGYEQNSSMVIETSVVQEAEWEKQHFVEISNSEGGVVSKDSGWYEEGEILHVNATPEYGFYFLSWENEDGIVLGYEEVFEINLSSPQSLWAEFEPKKKLTLEIISDYDYYSQEITYFENETAQLDVPEVMEEEYARHYFIEWLCNSSYGYNGTQNTASFPMVESVSQFAKWSTQYYVTSNDPSIAGWYEENKAIRLESSSQGLYNKKFKVNGEESSADFVTVTEPLSIETYSVINYTYLIIGGVVLLLVLIGVITYRQLTK
jgi:hypothetical protein